METRTVREIPILYSTEMVKAKLAGRKSQTRRTNKLDLFNQNPDDWEYVFEDGAHMFFSKSQEDLMYIIKSPFGEPGDLLWARETIYQEGELGLKYVADDEYIDDEKIPTDHKPYRNYAHCNIPSIHMPKYLARIWDRVVSVRVERLQDISEEDAIEEGIWKIDKQSDPLGGYTYKEHFGWISAVEAYRALWISINGLDSWEANPWVWVITTENVSLTGKPNI